MTELVTKGIKISVKTVFEGTFLKNEFIHYAFSYEIYIKNLSEDIKKYEPRMALDGGNDGLDLVKKVIYKSKNILKINGVLALEIGNEQIKKVSKILTDNNFRIRNVIKDYKNNVRCIIAYYK